MNCNDVMSVRTPYVDGELDAETAGTVRRHLDSCAACASAVETERTVARVVHSRMTTVRTPAYLRERILTGTSRAPAGTFERLREWLRSFRLGPVQSFALATVTVVAIAVAALIPGTTRSAGPDLVEAMVTGEVQCLDCYLYTKWQVDSNCALHGHRNGLVASDGTMWTFSNSPVWEPFRGVEDVWGSTIVVRGRKIPSAHYIDVESFEFPDGTVISARDGAILRMASAAH